MSTERRSANDSKVTIKIPRTLYTCLHETIADSGFRSVTEFIVYVLRDLVSIQNGSPGKEAPRLSEEDIKLTKKEIDAIRKRLKSLGYL